MRGAADEETRLLLTFELGGADAQLEVTASSGEAGSHTRLAGEVGFHGLNVNEVIDRLLEQFGLDRSGFGNLEIPDFLIDTTGVLYDPGPETGALAIEVGTTIDIGDVSLPVTLRFASGQVGEAPVRLLAARIDGALPFVRNETVAQFTGDLALSGIAVHFATGAVPADHGMLAPIGVGVPWGASGLPDKFSVGVTVEGGGSQTPILLPPPDRIEAERAGEARTDDGRATGVAHGSGVPPVAREGAAPRDDSDGDGALRKWFDVDKRFGPLEISRIGGEWKSPNLSLLLDANAELLGLKLGLSGLRVGFPPGRLSELKIDDVVVGLDGLALAFSSGPISISGAFLRQGDEFAGAARIETGAFTIAAIGSYARPPGSAASLFIYGAFAGAVIGGPPCFVVKGIAAGFGYNRGLTIPEIDAVRDFPLISLVLDPEIDASEALAGNQFPVAEGQYWVAAGVKFTSFELVDAFALVTVQFGVRFELAVLGVAAFQQPPPAPGSASPVRPFVFVEIAFRVRFSPDDGLFALDAALTPNSYLFDPSCRLRGGFAFYIWFEPTALGVDGHAGDFVLSLGGYHPHFDVPAHYPRPERVGFDWHLTGADATIKGEGYFALTPSCIMAGGRLLASVHAGPLRASFEAWVNFFVAWEPFHYEGDAGIWIDVSLTLHLGLISTTLHVHLGATLEFWGPPFAGTAHLDLGITSVTVAIGNTDAPRKPPTLSLQEFCDKLLPRQDQTPTPVTIVIAEGLLREVGDVAVVRADRLRLTVDSFIPVTALGVGTGAEVAEPPGDWPVIDRPPATGIRPLDLGSFSASLSIETSGSVNCDHWAPTLVRKTFPGALWSPRPAGPKPDRELIPDAAAGLSLVLKHATDAPGERCVDLTPEDEARPPSPSPPAPVLRGHASFAGPQTRKDGVAKALADDGVLRTRDALLSELRAFGFDLPTPDLAASYVEAMAAVPQVGQLGQLPALEPQT